MNTYQNVLHIPNTPDGLGDPFVLRYNGRYYLYPSTHTGQSGAHAWQSEDLVHWEDKGFVVRDACLENMYAPEVWHFNGQFLLVGSPFGQGHYLYTADNPLGPFTQVRDNFGLVIDGSIFPDDDGKLYFTHAEYPCIHGHEMTLDGQMSEPTVLHETGMGHWTEGPGIFKRQGKYYITMTGNHLLSRAYRIDYAISDVGPLGPYRVPRQKTILVNTDRAHGSLGHSSNVIGPDLDSYWICYHNFEIDDHGRHKRRNTNLDRMLFNGDRLMVSGPTRHFVGAPARPDAYGWADEAASRDAFAQLDGGVMLKKPAPASFTAEVNIVPGRRGEVMFGYKDDRNHFSVVIEQGALILSRVEDGQVQIINQKQLFEGFNPDALHTVRLEARGCFLNVLLDHMGQLYDQEVAPMDGAIGARSERISYVAFSRHVAQRSDYEHYNAIPGFIDAALFLPASEGTVSGGHPVAECGCRPEDGMRLVPMGEDGSYDLMLGAGEKVSYRLNAAQSGKHHVQAVLDAPTGVELKLRFQAGEMAAKVPPTDGLVRVELGLVELWAGFSSFDVTVDAGEARIARYELFPVASELKDEWAGLQLCFAAKQVEGLGSDGFLARLEGLQMDREVQAMGMFGSRFQTDGCIEADVRFRGDGASKSAGLFLRLSENSYHPDQIRVGHRGYYVGFDTKHVFIDRMNFDARTLAKADCALDVEHVYVIKAQIVGGKITVWLDGTEVISAYEPDPLPYGQLAVGSFGARVTFERTAVWAK